MLQYIVQHNLPICSVYGDIVEDTKEIDGQMTLFDTGQKRLKTTGCERTGCALCGFGCHLQKEKDRFVELKKTHPGMYKLLDIVSNNGVTMRQAIEYINEHSNANIKL